MMLSFEKVKIIDLSQVISGPLCSMILADLGAEVIKIEPPEGDAARSMGDTVLKGESDYILSLNRNKRSIVVDLKREEGREIFYRLLPKADVVLENFRLGTVEKLGVDYDTVSKLNPNIVYCSISGFGQTGPYKHRPAMDTIIQAMSGIMGITGDPLSGPQKVGSPIGDIIASLLASIGILWALYIREKTGEGQKIDISMLDGTIFSIIPREAYYFINGKSLPLTGNRHYQIAPCNSYRTKEGGYLMLIAHSQKHWLNLCESLNSPQLAADERFKTNADRLRNVEKLDQLLGEIFREKRQQEWVEFLTPKGVMIAPVYTLEQMFQDPQVLSDQIVQDLIHPAAGRIKVLKTPLKFSKTPPEIKTPSPLLGQHTTEILQEFGFSEKEIFQLKKNGVVGTTR